MAAVLAYCFRNRWTSLLCLLALALAWALPEQGFAMPLCQFRVMTRLPCLTCGLTRSFAGMAHLDVVRAGFYHPAGVVLFPAAAALGALFPAPRRTREGLARWAEKRPRTWNYLAGALVALFVVNGAGRIVWLLLSGRPSPW